jgi:cystathionine beta-lyase/cystathionine gamma-synthase
MMYKITSRGKGWFYISHPVYGFVKQVRGYSNAIQQVGFLESHPQHALAREQMRLGGTVIAVEITGGFDACQSLVSQLQVVRIATSFGGPETLVCHPATSTHVGLSPEALATMGVTDGLLRFSIGLEDADDLVDDIHRAIATL